MNGKKKPKQKTKDVHILEYLDDLEKDIKTLKLTMEKRTNKYLNFTKY